MLAMGAAVVVQWRRQSSWVFICTRLDANKRLKTKRIQSKMLAYELNRACRRRSNSKAHIPCRCPRLRWRRGQCLLCPPSAVLIAGPLLALRPPFEINMIRPIRIVSSQIKLILSWVRPDKDGFAIGFGGTVYDLYAYRLAFYTPLIVIWLWPKHGDELLVPARFCLVIVGLPRT